MAVGYIHSNERRQYSCYELRNQLRCRNVQAVIWKRPRSCSPKRTNQIQACADFLGCRAPPMREEGAWSWFVRSFEHQGLAVIWSVPLTGTSFQMGDGEIPVKNLLESLRITIWFFLGTQKSKEDLLNMWGRELDNPEDVFEIFVCYLTGKENRHGYKVCSVLCIKVGRLKCIEACG